MSTFGRIIILHRNGKDGPTYYLRQRVCTIGRGRACNIRMNLDQVAEQHAWITIDSKNQVWISNATEGQELRINQKLIPVGSRPVQLFHSTIIYIEGRAFRFEEEAFIERPIDKETPEILVVEESPVKEKQPTAEKSLTPIKQESAKEAEATTPKPSTHTSAGRDDKPKAGAKRKLAQSFDEVENSPAKRQKLTTETTNISRSVEIPATSAKKSCLSPTKQSRSEPKQKTLHQVRFMLPGQSVVKPQVSSEGDTAAKKSSSNSSRSSKEKSSSDSERAPKPAAKIVVAPKNNRNIVAKKPRQPAVKKPQPALNKKSEPARRTSLLAIILASSSESESEDESESESDEETSEKENKEERSKETKVKKEIEKERTNEKENEAPQNIAKSPVKGKQPVVKKPPVSVKSTDNSKKQIEKGISKQTESSRTTSQPQSKPKPEAKARHKHDESEESGSEDNDEDASNASSRSESDASRSGEESGDESDDESGSESCSASGDESGDLSGESGDDEASEDDESESEDEEASEGAAKKTKTTTEESKEPKPEAPASKEPEHSSQPTATTSAADPSSDADTTRRKTSSDIIREEEAAEAASEINKTADPSQQNPTANVCEVKEKNREPEEEDNTLPSSSPPLQSPPPVGLPLEDRISAINSCSRLDAVTDTDDLKAVLVAVFRKLGCDQIHLIKDIVERAVPLLPNTFTATDQHWELKLTDTLLVITDVIPRANALYYRLKSEYFPKTTLEQKLGEKCSSEVQSDSSQSQSKPVCNSAHGPSSEDILINGSYEEIFIRLKRKKTLLLDITTRKIEPESIKCLKRSRKLTKRDQLLCGGLSNDEVRLVLLSLTELFPAVAFDFIMSSLFTTAVAIVLLSRKPGTHHDDILATIGTRSIELHLTGTEGDERFQIRPVEGHT